MTQVDVALNRILAGARAEEVETVTLDFKEDPGSRNDLAVIVAKAAICFANAAGGQIVIGIADKQAGPSAFLGTDHDGEQLRQRVYELSRPPLLIEIEAIHKGETRLLVATVRSGSCSHTDTQGRSWHRVNRDCLPLSSADHARLAEERSGFDWSGQPSARSIGDVRPEAVAVARTLLANLLDRRRDLARLDVSDLLSAIGALTRERGLNRAGEAMFCDSVERDHVLVYQHKLTPGGEPRTIQRLPFPLVTAFVRVMEIVSARQSTVPVGMPNGQQITIEDFPAIAVREAISNAICHRDWRLSGGISVDHAPDVFSVTSPGPLMNGVTPDNILTIPSRPRNLALARAMRQLGLAEETGLGVDRMYRETIKSGRQPPVVESFVDRTRVSFVGGAPDTNIARFAARLPERESEDTDTMLLLYHLCRSRTVTIERTAALLQKPVAEAEAVLKRLSTEPDALLETNRHSLNRSKQVYRLRGEALRGLGAAVEYNRKTIDETDRKIIEHVREYGKVTNRTLQNLFDVHVFKARDILWRFQVPAATP